MAKRVVSTTKEQEDELIAVIGKAEAGTASPAEREAGEAAWLDLYALLHPLIYKVAENYVPAGASHSAFVAAGKRGLKKALRHYALGKRYKFSTYATWWIRAEVLRELRTPVT